MKFLIVGLGNIGAEYVNTRHNLGFQVLDAFAKASNTVFKDKRYGAVAEVKYKARKFILLKPSTFVNLSGNAVRYYLKKEKLDVSRLLIIADDVALPFGSIRIKPKGGAGGHNGLQNIIDVLGGSNYARLRFGIGGDFYSGEQVRYVLGKYSVEELQKLPEKYDKVIDAIKSFGSLGIERTMNLYNNQ